MNHFYADLPGWFKYSGVYDQMVAWAKDGDVFVEVGTYAGRSTAYLLVQLFRSGKRVLVNSVDRWEDTAELRAAETVFRRSVEARFSEAELKVWKGDSVCVARAFEDRSVSFVWLDADHEYASIKQDIEAWLPKVRPGGYIGGDDYSSELFPGVVQAVKESFPEEGIELRKQEGWVTWLHQVR